MITVKPFDVFLFGDGKEFNKGEQSFRQGSFFINPIPILGALNRETDKKLNINFISLEKGGKLYFKMPLDIKVTKPKTDGTGDYIKPKIEKTNCITNKEIEYILNFDTKEKIQDINMYVSQQIFKDYLTNNLKLPKNKEEIDSIKLYSELRSGIEIDHESRTAKESMLFFQFFTRLEDGAGFFVNTNTDINVKWLKIGGEGKGFKVEKSDNLLSFFDDIKEKTKSEIMKTKAFKIILLTPTNSIPEIQGAELVAKIVGKPITYSGWFSFVEKNVEKKVNGKPTRIFRLIPEGSVFYYKLTDISKVEEIFNRFWFKPSFYVKEFPYFDINRPAGFGITAITYTQI